MDKKNLEKRYSMLNKEYVALDKQNDSEENVFVLENNYKRMDEIQSEMAKIADELEKL